MLSLHWSRQWQFRRDNWRIFFCNLLSSNILSHPIIATHTPAQDDVSVYKEHIKGWWYLALQISGDVIQQCWSRQCWSRQWEFRRGNCIDACSKQFPLGHTSDLQERELDKVLGQGHKRDLLFEDWQRMAGDINLLTSLDVSQRTHSNFDI